jgi:hypothetical protein
MTFLFFLLLLLAASAAFTAFFTRRVEAHFHPPGRWLEVEGERLP